MFPSMYPCVHVDVSVCLFVPGESPLLLGSHNHLLASRQPLSLSYGGDNSPGRVGGRTLLAELLQLLFGHGRLREWVLVEHLPVRELQVQRHVAARPGSQILRHAKRLRHGDQRLNDKSGCALSEVFCHHPGPSFGQHTVCLAQHILLALHLEPQCRLADACASSLQQALPAALLCRRHDLPRERPIRVRCDRSRRLGRGLTIPTATMLPSLLLLVI
mmetsp:Transcript_20479/g.58488  ORF Transcript_20479/g.58488 Transcript_20479/m.58488 type:complete len:217 (-) Transcript_20479:1426-2076(-)